MTQLDKNKEKRFKKDNESPHEIWVTIQQPNVYIMGEQKEKGIENLFNEIIVEHFLSWKKHRHEDVQRTPGRLSWHRSPWHIAVKLAKGQWESSNDSEIVRLHIKENQLE